jgi:uncharacterized secreted protein with C-terminal beta-propeller domain
MEAGVESALVECAGVYNPAQVGDPGLVVVAALDMNDALRPVTTTGVLGGGMQLYASKQSLYLAQSSWAWTWKNEGADVKTHVHKLKLDPKGGAPVYLASGVVPGWLLNQFSMSEQADHVRLATTESTWRNQAGGNNVFVMKQVGSELVVVGELRNLSPGEQIYSARFLSYRAYLVTFERIDPLHSIDLSDPTKPVELGELEVPGFSTYLHPVEGGYLLAIGDDGKQNVQLSFFDVRNPAKPLRLHAHTVAVGDWGSHSAAMYDHHAFTYHPNKKILAIPINVYSSGHYFTGAMVFRVGPENGFEPLGRVDHSDIARAASCPQWSTDEQSRCYDEYRWWANMRRSIFIEDYLYTLSSVGLSVDELLHPQNHLASLVF